MYNLQQDSSSPYFLTVREDQHEQHQQQQQQNLPSPQLRRFKVKFRSREEFFAVTVSKLRRAISAVLEKSTTTATSSISSSFSLEFEQVEEDSIDTTFKICRLPEGQLAELALIYDWGVKPGMNISLIWQNNNNNNNNNVNSNNTKVTFLL